jgi:hypothetical protein
MEQFVVTGFRVLFRYLPGGAEKTTKDLKIAGI